MCLSHATFFCCLCIVLLLLCYCYCVTALCYCLVLLPCLTALCYCLVLLPASLSSHITTDPSNYIMLPGKPDPAQKSATIRVRPYILCFTRTWSVTWRVVGSFMMIVKRIQALCQYKKLNYKCRYVSLYSCSSGAGLYLFKKTEIFREKSTSSHFFIG
jgi:hypothetical protein